LILKKDSDSDSSNGSLSNRTSSNSSSELDSLDSIYLNFLLQNKGQDYSEVGMTLKEKSNEEKIKEIFELDKLEKLKEGIYFYFITS
jgi:hypothetical protein